MSHKDWIERIVSVAILLGIWQAAAMIVSQSILLASPVDVVVRLGTLWMEEEFVSATLYSLSRIAAGFFLSLACGIVCAILASKFHAVEVMLRPLMLTIKTVPVVSIILICLIWMTSGQLTAFIVFLMVFPVVYANLLEGILSTDENMQQMASVFHVPYAKRLLYIYLPQIKPFLISACSVSIGMAWKSGIAAEVLSVPDGSIGEMLYTSKVYFHTTDLLAWTVLVVLLSLLFEKLFIKALEFAFARMEKL